MAENEGRTGSGGVRLLFPCSGAADTGEMSDRVARRLARGGGGRMFCLAAIGGRVPGKLDGAKRADEIWAIDGCEDDCAKRTLELAGFTVTKHLRVTDCGFEKGKSPATEEHVAVVLGKVLAKPAAGDARPPSVPLSAS